MSSLRKKDKLFHFKQFSVRHDRSGMKVGTDGVLLGAWTNLVTTEHILDIGTGTGVIALMLAQRSGADTHIDAIEIDQEGSADASENFNASPWANRLTLFNDSVQDFKSDKQYDLIVSNPPYFQNSFNPPDAQRKTARHTHTLQFEDILNASDRLLAKEGRLSVILPFTEGLQFIWLAMARGYQCSRKWGFRSRVHKPVERWLMEFTRQETTCEEGEIVLYERDEEWTKEYKNMTRDFYLKI